MAGSSVGARERVFPRVTLVSACSSAVLVSHSSITGDHTMARSATFYLVLSSDTIFRHVVIPLLLFAGKHLVWYTKVRRMYDLWSDWHSQTIDCEHHVYTVHGTNYPSTVQICKRAGGWSISIIRLAVFQAIIYLIIAITNSIITFLACTFISNITRTTQILDENFTKLVLFISPKHKQWRLGIH